jgi:exodeoxyribonuclease-5
MDVVPQLAEDAEDEHGRIANVGPDEFCARMLDLGSESKILAFTNASVDWCNAYVRSAKFGANAAPFCVGERLVVVESIEINYKVTLHAETELTVRAAKLSTREGLPCWRLDVDDCVIHVLDDAQRPAFLDALGAARSKGRALGKAAWADYYRLSEAFARVRPGWATTIHKSQGSTYDDVLLIQSDVLRSAGRDHAFRNMLLYVAYSRTRKGLYLS